LDLVFKIDFENWTSYLLFKKIKPISNIQKGYQIHFKNISPVFENVKYIIKQYLLDIQVSFHNPDKLFSNLIKSFQKLRIVHVPTFKHSLCSPINHPTPYTLYITQNLFPYPHTYLISRSRQDFDIHDILPRFQNLKSRFYCEYHKTITWIFHERCYLSTLTLF